ncbi:MAG: M48 family metallopeptidase [Gemmatimonadota bacterium]
MAMDDAAFAALVERLERRAAHAPTAYRLRVLGLAALGYGYMLGVLLLLIAVAILLVATLRGLAIKLVIPLLVVIGAVARALWVHLPAPEGVPLKEADAPALFTLVRQVQRQLRAPRVHTILIIPEVNAAAVQLPRLGLLGWYHNYLLIGLPLLQALAPSEWQAVLAHELGHLSGRHGRFGAWIYRTRATWGRLLPIIEAKQSAVGRFLFHGFLEWYGPWFNAHTFVLARAQEFEADAASAEIAGADAARGALLRLEIADHVAGGFWVGLEARVRELSEPPQDPFQQLRFVLASGVTDGSGTERIMQAWQRTKRYDDTHPGLADRLGALGWSSSANEPPPPPEPLHEPSSASVYLGPTETKLAQAYDARWVGQVKESWQARHATLAVARETLTRLDGQSDVPLTPEEEWNRISACITLDETDRIKTLCCALLEREPDNAVAHFQLGRSQLERGDAEGVAHVEAAMRLDSEAIVPCCIVLMRYYEGRGEAERVEQYRTVGLTRERLLKNAEQERRFLTKKATLVVHGWEDTQVASLVTQLAKIPGVGEAWLARRVVTFMVDRPCYVLFVLPRTPWWMRHDRKRAGKLVQAVAQQVACPEPLQIFHLAGPLRPLRKRLTKIPGARIV